MSDDDELRAPRMQVASWGADVRRLTAEVERLKHDLQVAADALKMANGLAVVYRAEREAYLELLIEWTLAQCGAKTRDEAIAAIHRAVAIGS